MSLTLLTEKHIQYVKALDTQYDELQYWLSEHLRLSGLYWGLTALDLMHAKDALPRDEVVKFVKSCQQPNGGLAPHPNHDAHLLYTLSGLQILLIEDALDVIDREKCIEYVLSLQKEDGSCMGDEWGEVDTRFVYTAVQSLAILKALDRLDRDKTVSFIMKCYNFDGGFGLVPGAESHAAQIFTCVGTLAILNRMDAISNAQKEAICFWLAERQTPDGGLNGRPEKLPDVCYSWWALSTLAMFDRVDWIDRAKLTHFILDAQDTESGGIADRKGDVTDVYHTVFGIAGLSLMGYGNLEPIDPRFCLPTRLTGDLVYK